MAKDKDDLVAAIDKTAFTLLRKIDSGGTMTEKESIILTEQVKSFAEVVKWATVRVGLVPKENTSDAKFALIKGEFHNAASRTPRSRRAAGASPAEVGPAAEPGDDAGASADDLL